MCVLEPDLTKDCLAAKVKDKTLAGHIVGKEPVVYVVFTVIVCVQHVLHIVVIGQRQRRVGNGGSMTG